MKQALHTIQRSFKRNTPVLLSATAITGVVTTAYLSGKAAISSRDRIRTYQDLEPYFPDRKDRIIHDVKLCWKLYIPATASGAVTIFCIIGTTRVTNKRAAAAQAAFVLSERAYSEYRNKVVEEYGERKDQGIRDSIAQDKVQKTPPSATMVVGMGDVICCELHTMRYFTSDMETLRRTVNELNSQLLRHDQITLDDFYHSVGLPGTSQSGEMGWYSDRLLELDFTTVLDDYGRPCLAFNYNYIRPMYEGLYK